MSSCTPAVIWTPWGVVRATPGVHALPTIRADRVVDARRRSVYDLLRLERPRVDQRQVGRRPTADVRVGAGGGARLAHQVAVAQQAGGEAGGVGGGAAEAGSGREARDEADANTRNAPRHTHAHMRVTHVNTEYTPQHTKTR